MKRTIAAFLIAPLIPAVIFFQGAGPAVAAGYSYLFSYALGIPVFLLLKKKKKESHLLYGLLGFAVGAFYVLVPAVLEVHLLDSNALLAALMFGAIGTMVSLCFSLVRGVERKTPNQSIEPTAFGRGSS